MPDMELGLLFWLVVYSAIQVADQWDRAVILRRNHFHSLRRAGTVSYYSGDRRDSLLDQHPCHHDLKENSTIVIVPSTAVESMQLEG